MSIAGFIFVTVGISAIIGLGVADSKISHRSQKSSDTYFDGEKLYNELSGHFGEMKAAYESGDRVRIYIANIAEMQCVNKIKQFVAVQDDSTMNFLPANDIGWLLTANAVNKPVRERRYWYRQIGALVQEINTYRYIRENTPVQV